MAVDLNYVRQSCEQHLNEIADLFRDNVKITLAVRTPGKPDRDFVLSIDSKAEVLAMVERRMP